jgi:hypothetical protein
MKKLRMVLLSKTGKAVVKPDETRPLCINSHAFKIIKKMIVAKLEKSKSKFLETQDWQRGCKKGK